MLRDNTSLGEFNLDGLAPAPRGIPKIDATFNIDANGILNLTAKDRATGKSQSITISGSIRLLENDKNGAPSSTFSSPGSFQTISPKNGYVGA